MIWGHHDAGRGEDYLKPCSFSHLLMGEEKIMRKAEPQKDRKER